MKVLWFSGVAFRKARVRQGMHLAEGPASWQESLLHEMRGVDTVHIGVAAPIEGGNASFEEDHVTYYCLPQNTSKQKVVRGLRRWVGYDDTSNQLAAALKAVNTFKPDLIHIHGTENPFGLLRHSTDIPIIISLQGLLTPCCHAFFRGLTVTDISRLFANKYFINAAGEIHGYSRMRRYAKREREIMRINTAFIGRTEWDHAFQKILSPHAKYFHCDEVIRPVFYEKAWHLDTSCPQTIFSTSSSMIFKGTETLLEAIQMLHQMGHSDIKVRIAGVPDKGEVSDFYRRKAKQYKVEDAVTWLGRLNAEEILQELLRASLFVYPSHIDNSPNSLIEAMLVGVPSVATFVGGIPSLMSNESEGWLVPDSNALSLAGTIDFALKNPDWRIKMGQNARARSLGRNSPAAIARKMAAIYKQIAGQDLR
jgi:glycosyltransferase involved in cell wall biosynthesis